MSVEEHIEQQLKLKRPFVLYSPPGSEVLKVVFQEDEVQYTDKDATSGFVIHAFDGSTTWVLPFDRSEVFEVPFVAATIEVMPVEHLTESIESKRQFMEAVTLAIDAIKKEKMQKVVLSRTMDVPFSKHKPLVLLRLLKSLYNNAFCYYFYHPKTEVWTGASPELLLKHQAGNIQTVSLAGTRSHRTLETLDWTDKEYQEQGLVTRYIESQLQKHCVEVYVGELQNQQAGPLFHLKTELRGVLKDSASLSSLIEDLHPTPAVCGLPLEAAQDFIIKHEGYDRRFYTGYLGEYVANREAESRLYVNLRCMQLLEDRATIYVGCGITADSDPEAEYLETVQKSAVMRRILQN